MTSYAQTPAWRRLLTASFGTDGRYTTLLLRLTLALAILPHGIQKTLGWWGGYGYTNTMAAFTQMMGIPAPFALAAILAESLGAVLLLFGLLTRLSAFAIGVTMFVAVWKVHWAGGFFMPNGFEYFVPVIAIALFLVIRGGGKWALDKNVHDKLSR